MAGVAGSRGWGSGSARARARHEQARGSAPSTAACLAASHGPPCPHGPPASHAGPARDGRAQRGPHQRRRAGSCAPASSPRDAPAASPPTRVQPAESERCVRYSSPRQMLERLLPAPARQLTQPRASLRCIMCSSALDAIRRFRRARVATSCNLANSGTLERRGSSGSGRRRIARAHPSALRRPTSSSLWRACGSSVQKNTARSRTQLLRLLPCRRHAHPRVPAPRACGVRKLTERSISSIASSLRGKRHHEFHPADSLRPTKKCTQR